MLYACILIVFMYRHAGSTGSTVYVCMHAYATHSTPNSVHTLYMHTYYMCNELGGYMARFTQFPIMITRSTIIYEIISPGAAGSSIYV